MAGFLLRRFQQLHPHQRGRLAENLVRLLYLCRGYRLVRFHGKHPPRLPAQIDLLCRRGRTLVLVEVKYRTDPLRRPFALRREQQIRLIRAARFLTTRLPWVRSVRADVVLLGPQWPFVRRIPAAFTSSLGPRAG